MILECSRRFKGRSHRPRSFRGRRKLLPLGRAPSRSRPCRRRTASSTLVLQPLSWFWRALHQGASSRRRRDLPSWRWTRFSRRFTARGGFVRAAAVSAGGTSARQFGPCGQEPEPSARCQERRGNDVGFESRGRLELFRRGVASRVADAQRRRQLQAPDDDMDLSRTADCTSSDNSRGSAGERAKLPRAVLPGARGRRDSPSMPQPMRRLHSDAWYTPRMCAAAAQVSGGGEFASSTGDCACTEVVCSTQE